MMRVDFPRPVRGDLVAGASVALILIPQSLAYAQLAGVPAGRGTARRRAPPIAASIVASSPYLQTGPVTLTALLTYGALVHLAEPGSDAWIALSVLLALIVGVVRLAVGLLRAGGIAYLVSQPMLLGFLPAAATLIVASQLPDSTAADVAKGSTLSRAADVLSHPDGWQLSAVALALLSMALIIGGRRINRLFPGVVIAVAFGLVYAKASGYGGPVVGPIPTSVIDHTGGLPLDAIPSLIVPGIIIALAGFVEPASVARTFAVRERQRWDPDREFASQGMANIASAVAGGIPVGGSLSRSSLAYLAGAKTRWSGAVAGMVVLLVLPFVGVLSTLPRAVLGGIVLASVIDMLRPLPMLRLSRYSRPQFLVAVATFALTLALAPRIDLAIVAGIGLAIAVHLWRELNIEGAVLDGGDDAPSPTAWGPLVRQRTPTRGRDARPPCRQPRSRAYRRPPRRPRPDRHLRSARPPIAPRRRRGERDRG